MNENLKTFLKFRNQSFEEIIKLANKQLLTEFEKKLFTALCTCSYNLAEHYFNSSKLPLHNLKKITNFDLAIKGWVFLNVIELESFLKDCEITPEVKNIVDVSEKKIIEDFGKIFSGEDIDKYITTTLNSIKNLNGSAKSLEKFWVGELFMFISLISNNEVDTNVLSNKESILGIIKIVEEINIKNIESKIKILF